MKTNLALLNSIGFTNAHQKCLYAAKMLKTATVSSPAVTISPMVPAIPGKAAVVGHPAYPARAASAPVPATANTAGVAAGALYLNSPAYPPNTAIPTIPDKPATPELLSSPKVDPVPQIPAVASPAIVAIPGWADTITIAATPTKIDVEVFLPYASGAKLFGASTNGTTSIGEITPSGLVVTNWLDTKASAMPETISSEPATLEQYFYKYAVICGAAGGGAGTPVAGHVEIVDTVKMISANNLSVKRVRLSLPTSGYDPASDSLQLNKVLPDVIFSAT